MAYKLYNDKSSLKKRKSRLLQGGLTTVNGNKLAWWDRRNSSADDTNEIKITLDHKYALRPDIVAFDHYGSCELEWVVLQYNNIVDVTEEFTYGKNIVIPSRSFVNNYIINKATGTLK